MRSGLISVRCFLRTDWQRARSTVVLLSVVAMLFAPASARINRYKRDLEPVLEKFIETQQIPGVAIAVVENGRVVYQRGFGWKSIDKTKGPVTADTIFHMASITKPFVATAIMQLVEQKKVGLDNAVVSYLPDFRLADERYKQITVRQLLTHTSGLPDVTDYEWNRPQFDDAALDRYVRSLSSLQLLFAPGTRFAYSNIAYEVLGDIIAKVSGESFEEYVKDHILRPLGMKSSTLLSTDVPRQFMSDGHVLDAHGEPARSPVYPYNRTHSPSSNLFSDTRDMVRWALANMNHGQLDGRRILHPLAYELMWKPAETLGDVAGQTRVTAEGLSWFLGTYRGNFLVTHSGGDTGFITDLAMLPDKKIAVVWMANCDWIDHGPINGPITYAALDVALGSVPQPITFKRSLARALYSTFRQYGIQAALDEFAILKKHHSELFDFSEKQLDDLGQRLMQEGSPREGVRFFRLNASSYPRSARAYERLAGGYEAIAESRLAACNYEKAVELDPNMTRARQALEHLKNQAITPTSCEER